MCSRTPAKATILPFENKDSCSYRTLLCESHAQIKPITFLFSNLVWKIKIKHITYWSNFLSRLHQSETGLSYFLTQRAIRPKWRQNKNQTSLSLSLSLSLSHTHIHTHTHIYIYNTHIHWHTHTRTIATTMETNKQTKTLQIWTNTTKHILAYCN